MRIEGKEHAGRKWTMAERRRRRERADGKQEKGGEAAACSGRREGRK